MTETQLSKAIRDALEKAGYWCERINSGPIPTRGGFIHGASNGTPDILIVAPIYAWLEVKLPGKPLGLDQVKWHERASKHGIRVERVSSVEDAVRVVRSWT